MVDFLDWRRDNAPALEAIHSNVEMQAGRMKEAVNIKRLLNYTRGMYEF